MLQEMKSRTHKVPVGWSENMPLRLTNLLSGGLKPV